LKYFVDPAFDLLIGRLDEKITLFAQYNQVSTADLKAIVKSINLLL